LVNIHVEKIIPPSALSSNKVIFLHEALERLLQIATDANAELNAPLIGRTDSENTSYVSDGEFGLIGLANGFMIRNFPLADYCLSTSVRDLFKSLKAVTPVGLWYSESADKWYLKDIADFYKNTEIISLGEVKGFERYVDEQYYFNTIKAGYIDGLSYEEINGLENQNCLMKFTNNIAGIKNEKDLQSIYRADDYGIEFAKKIPYNYNGTEDSRYDSDIWFLTFKRDSGSFLTLAGYDNFDTISGVLSKTTRLNIDITPKRNLLRNGSLLSIPMWKQTSGDILYSDSQMRINFSSKKAAEAAAIVETDDIDITTLPEPEFHPEVYNFSSPVTAAQITSLMTDPHGYITFTYLGTTYKGYILEVSTEPWGRKGNWTLIKTNPSK